MEELKVEETHRETIEDFKEEDTQRENIEDMREEKEEKAIEGEEEVEQRISNVRSILNEVKEVELSKTRYNNKEEENEELSLFSYQSDRIVENEEIKAEIKEEEEQKKPLVPKLNLPKKEENIEVKEEKPKIAEAAEVNEAKVEAAEEETNIDLLAL